MVIRFLKLIKIKQFLNIILTKPQNRQNMEGIGYTLLIMPLAGRVGKNRPLCRLIKNNTGRPHFVCVLLLRE